MKKLILCLMLGVFFAQVGGAGDAKEQEAVIRKFLRAKFSNDLETLKSTILPDEEIKELVRGARAPESEQEKKRFEEFLSGISLKSEKSEKDKAIYLVQMGGMVMPMDVVKTKDGWKVDPKWWIAAMKKPSKEIIAIKKFFFAVMTKKADDLLKLSLPNEKLFVLTAGNPPPGADAGILMDWCGVMPVIEIKPGEKYVTLAGEEKMNDNKEFRLFQGVFGGGAKKLLFKIKETGGEWKVNAQPYIDLTLKNESKEAIEKAKKEFSEKVFREQIFATLKGEGDIEELKKFLEKGISGELKTSLLNSVYQQYWYNNQSGELKKGSNWIKMIEMLIDNGADMEKKDYMGHTLLLQAIRSANGHNQELVELLIKKGADVNAQTADGLYVMDNIPEYKHDDFQKILKKAGAKSRMLSKEDEKKLGEIVKSNNSKEIIEKVLPVICYSSDSNWAQNICIELLGNSDNKVKKAALATLPKISSVHNGLSKDKIKPILEKALKDPDKSVRDQASDTVAFMNKNFFWKIRNFQKKDKGEIYSFKSGSPSIKIPDINTDMMEIKEAEPNPGITRDVKFFGKNGWTCVMIVTKIRKELPKDDSVLDRVEGRSKSMERFYGKENLIINNYTNENKRRTLEVIVKNAQYDEISYPYGQGVDRGLKGLKTISISQYIIRKGYMIEVALFMKNDNSLPGKEFLDNAQKRIKKIVEGITI